MLYERLAGVSFGLSKLLLESGDYEFALLLCMVILIFMIVHVLCRIANLLRAIGRVIRAREEQRCVETSSKPAVPFNILTDPRFQRVKLAANEAVMRAVQAGLGKEALKSDVLSRSEEKLMLDSNEASVSHPTGLNRRFAYFCTRNFFVRGGREMRECDSGMFHTYRDQYGDEFLRYSYILIII